MKKALSLLLAMGLTVSMAAGCGSGDSGSTAEGNNAAADGAENSAGNAEGTEAAGGAEGVSDIKVGIMYIGDENEGYTAAHMAGIDEMMAALGLSEDQVIEKTTIKEDETCYDAAIDLAEQGCNIIFGNSFGFESYMIQAAAEYPEIEFCHATGFQAATAGLPNMHNYFTAVYESRYVSGVVAGLKLNEMIEAGTITAEEAKMGYVGAFPYAEVISGYTSFYLGAKSVCPTVTMDVQYTNSWADMAGEAEVAAKLIDDGCVLISQHADTTGAPSTCEEKGVPCVGYNIDMTSVAPNSALTSASINWAPYYTYAVQSVMEGKAIDTDWCQGYAQGANRITALNETSVPAGAAEKAAEVEEALKGGTLHVFDTTTFTVNGSSLEDLIAQGGDYEKYSAYVYDGYFHESELASAPAFDIIIDGINSVAE